MGCSPSIPLNESIYSLDTIKDMAQTGDIVLFSGQGPISTCVRLFSESVWSHVAVIFRSNNNQVFVWECSQDDKLYDSISGEKKRGARLVLWEEMFMGGYDGYFIALRKLRWDTNLSMLNEQVAQLKNQWQNDQHIGMLQIFKNMIDIDYCSDLLPLVGSTMNSFHDHPGSFREEFCTQLTIETLRSMQIAKPSSTICNIPMEGEGKQSYKYKLDDFTSKHGNGIESLDLYDWASYSAEYYAEIPKKHTIY